MNPVARISTSASRITPSAVAATLPDREDFASPTLASWTRHPPRLELNHPHHPVTAAGLGDGRHRLSLLRSLIEPQEPEFPVLVQIYR
ncbi:hypothetical protein MPHLEI_20589 [Mycolicibacterium phlei RIVM601174]|nr:hypothetical protein MPHLEI_20589 [Mycolicibacterium phlei RIVM601174]MBF4190524.1 hypothetical protein [Mycolicibacterium phlei]